MVGESPNVKFRLGLSFEVLHARKNARKTMHWVMLNFCAAAHCVGRGLKCSEASAKSSFVQIGTSGSIWKSTKLSICWNVDAGL